jgi:predicted branched-subunit amino acid permease
MLQSVRPGARTPAAITEPRSITDPRPRSASRAGVEAMVPFILGLSPVALIVGATIGAHEARWAAWMGVWPIFSGNAHVATVRALHDAGAAVAILTGLAVNTRVAAYGFAVAGRWQHQPRWFRLLAPCLLVDPTFAAAEHHAAHHPDPTEQRRFFLAAGLTLGVAFWALVTAGMLVGDRIDGGLGLEIAVPLCLVASLGTRVRARPAGVAAALGALVIVASGGWPSGTGMLVAIAAGAAGGLLAEGGRPR